MAYLLTINDRIEEIKEKAVFGTFLLTTIIKSEGDKQKMVTRDDWTKCYLWINKNTLIDFYGDKIVALQEINTPNIFVGGFVFTENKKDFLNKASQFIDITFWNKLLGNVDKKIVKSIGASNLKQLILNLVGKDSLDEYKLLAFINKNAKRIF